jgi:hypothetical protein
MERTMRTLAIITLLVCLCQLGAIGQKAQPEEDALTGEAAVTDARLQKPVHLAVRGIACTELCRQLQEQTGVVLIAGRVVADDKITVFCEKRPLRNLMRAVSRLFGFTWMRSGETGAYQYELTQTLRSQLAEEALRNRDKNEALIALDQAMERYRKYLNLSPEEARERAKAAPEEEKKLLERYARGWGPAHLYFGLSRDERTALFNGQKLTYSTSPEYGEQPMSPDMARGITQSFADFQFIKEANGDITMIVPDNWSGLIRAADGFRDKTASEVSPDAPRLALDAVPDVEMITSLHLGGGELGQWELDGRSRFAAPSREDRGGTHFGCGFEQISSLAVEVSPSVRDPRNAEVNARFAKDPLLRPRVTIAVNASCRSDQGPRVTTADVEEAIHKATGLDIVADYYTRLFPPGEFVAKEMTRFDALCHLGDRMHALWNKDSDLILFRSTSFFNDRLTEIPNRLLTRWMASRKKNGALTVEDCIAISRLTDAQLDSQRIEDGVRAQYGLKEWEQVKAENMRPHWRFLAGFPPSLQQKAMSEQGVTFAEIPISLQQRYVALAYGPKADLLKPGLRDLLDSTFRLEYALPAHPLTNDDPPANHAARFYYRFGNSRQFRLELTPGGVVADGPY